MQSNGAAAGQVTLILIGLSVIFYVIIATLPDVEVSAPIWTDTLTILMHFACMPLIGGIIAVVLVGEVITQSYQWRTLHLWLSHGAHAAAWREGGGIAAAAATRAARDAGGGWLLHRVAAGRAAGSA